MRYRFAVALAVALLALFTDAVSRDAHHQVRRLEECRAWRVANVALIEAGDTVPAQGPNALCHGG
jgi:hypothetical protein